jgi:ATP-dependent Clp protease adapter protein ClpS
MEFVVAVLSAHVGLSSEDSIRMMVRIHRRGGALISTPSLVDAQRVAAQITAEATTQGYPLVCTAVSMGP